MKTTQTGLNLIKHFEGLHDGDMTKIGLQPKMDPIGIWTEGYGRAMRDKKGNFIKGAENKKLALSNATISTELEATEALAKDVRVFENIVARKIKIDLKANEFDALVSYTYNTGGSDTLFSLINKNASKEEIHKWFTTKYISAGGIKLKGLIERRRLEAKLFFNQ